MSSTGVISYAIVAAASLFFAVAPLLRRYRAISWWMRSVFFAIALSGVAWSALGFWILFHSTALSGQTRWRLHSGQATLGGIFFGLLTSLFLSPEFWRLRRRPLRLGAWLESLIKT
jgi:hypothetical protein